MNRRLYEIATTSPIGTLPVSLARYAEAPVAKIHPIQLNQSGVNFSKNP